MSGHAYVLAVWLGTLCAMTILIVDPSILGRIKTGGRFEGAVRGLPYAVVFGSTYVAYAYVDFQASRSLIAALSFAFPAAVGLTACATAMKYLFWTRGA